MCLSSRMAGRSPDALKLLLDKMGMVVDGPVATAAEAQCLAAEHSPDLAVVDVDLQGEMAYAS